MEKKSTKGEKTLFPAYGEFDSMEEINSKALELKGEPAKLKELAKENGIGKDMVELFEAGYLPELIPSPDIAAIGKLEVEVAALDNNNAELGSGIADYLKQKAMEDKQIARAIRKKGKKLEEVCKQAWEEAGKRKKGNCAYIPPFEIFQMARTYYRKEEQS